MSVSIDKDPAAEGEDARGVLASWLDDYISGRCDRADMQESFLSVCRSNPEAPWDALALLDQYQRRGRIDMDLARSLKTDIAQLVFGVASQTDSPRESHEADPSLDTTGSRWRKLAAQSQQAESATAATPERSAPPSASTIAGGQSPQTKEHPFVDPTLFRREVDLSTRPPALQHRHESQRPVGARAMGASDVLRNRYELLSILGRGTSGTVYKALDRHRTHLAESARYVAIKVLKLNYRDRPEALAELEREFHQAQTLSHPNIATVFDLDCEHDAYYIVMELLEGELLSDILRRLDDRPMQREYALTILSSIGAALAHAHRRGIVHADLKPRNIMITAGGEVRVLNFGFARNRLLELHSASALHDLPIPAPAYASVERVNGSEPNQSDDVYSLACIAYEMLSGQHPFGGRSAVLARAHGRRPAHIPGLTRKQWHALQRALLWTRGERQIDVVELLSALGCTEASSQRVVLPEQVMAQPARSWRWRVVAMAIFVLLACAVAALLYVRPNLARPNLDFDMARCARDIVAPGSMPGAAGDQQAGEAASVTEAPDENSSGVPAPAPGSRTAVADSGQAGNASQTTQAPAVTASGTAGDSAAAAVREPTAAGSQGSGGGGVSIGFDKDTYVATEGDAAVYLHVRRAGSVREPVTFTWVLRGNSAEAGADFADIGPGTETIAAGSREFVIAVPLVSDSIVENTELFLVEIDSVQEGVELAERARAAVIIVDDD